MQAALRLGGGKLTRPARLNAVAAGLLVHIMDQLTGRRFLVDTGASFSILPHQSSLPASGPKLEGPAGLPITCWGDTEVQLKFSGQLFRWRFLRAAVKSPILGVDFLRAHRLMVDPAGACLVQSHTKRRFAATTKASGPTTAVITFPEGESATCGQQGGGVTCNMQGAAENPLIVGRHSGDAGQESTKSVGRHSGDAGQGEWQYGGVAAVANGTPPNFQRLLEEFADVLNPSKRLPVTSHDVEHFLETKGPPLKQPFRRLDAEKLAAAKSEFAQLERDGIIRRSDSPWASPLHMVKKPDGSWRPCGDYRRLNLVTTPDSYPLPNMMDFQGKVAGCKYFSKIDLRKGYHQIPMHPADIPKTAIVTPFGLWEFLRLTFGLRNAGCTFQRLMHRVLSGVEAAFPFVDDVLVASATYEQNVADVRAVLERLREAGLVLNGEKCIFGATEVDFLGHHVTAAGISPIQDKVEGVLRHPRPVTMRQLLAFLGMFNFYRRFIPAAARILRPLTEATKGSPKLTEEVSWDLQMEAAFEAAKSALAAAALLRHPIQGASLALMVDASADHVGAALQQRVSPSSAWQPLGFFSRKLNAAEVKYSAFDRELLACTAGIRHFRYMLEGNLFTIYVHGPQTSNVCSLPGH